MKGNKEDNLPAEPWQIFLWARQRLSIETIMQAFGVASSQAYRYCENPRFQDQPRRNPLENIRILFEEMACTEDGDEVVQIALNYLAQAINASIRKNGSSTPDQDSLHAELLDNHPKFAELEQAMLRGDPLSHVQVLLQQAKAELDQDLEAYKREWGIP